jgi:hypothetical protein
LLYRSVALLLAICAAAFAVRAPGEAADLFPVGATGYDVSFPQCNAPLPSTSLSFAIVGATGGKPFMENPCLATQFAWATGKGRQPSLYMNLKSPVGTNAEEALAGPRGVCQPTDEMCKGYNFGHKSAQHAVAYAKSRSALPASWWLDVETMNTWLLDTKANAQVIQGAIDYLQGQGATVGIYSNPAQWQTIAGSYAPGLPVWTTLARGAADAPSFCARGFGGGQVVLVQYIVNGFDVNYVCRAEDRVVAPPLPTAPLGPTGSLATIAAEGDCLNLRSQPSVAGSVRTCVASGSIVTLLDGAVMAEGLRWQMVSAGPQTGWMAATYLRAGASVVTPPPAPPAVVIPSGTFAGTPVFGSSRMALVVFTGGSVEQLEAAAIAGGASGVWAQEAGGTYRLFVVGGPTFVNAPFRAAFPDGLRTSTALTLTR